MKKLVSFIFIVLFSSVAAAPAAFAGALREDISDQLVDVSKGLYGQTATPAPLPEIIGGIIKGLLGIVGVILVVLIIYAGFLYMTAHGESEQVEKAKKIIKNAVIGLIIMIAAYSITLFVVSAIVGTATP